MAITAEAEHATGVGVAADAELGGTPVDERDELVQDVVGQAEGARPATRRPVGGGVASPARPEASSRRGRRGS